MTIQIHKDIKRFMEKHGIEGDSISHNDGNLYIELEDLEVAFQLRELVLDHHSCCLISHPVSKLPTLMIHEIVNQ